LYEFARSLEYPGIDSLPDSFPAKFCLLKNFLKYVVAACIFYVLKAIGNDDFAGGIIPRLNAPFPLLPIFILVLYAISNSANVGINPSAIYANDSSISIRQYIHLK
jgi:hypothetical protein